MAGIRDSGVKGKPPPAELADRDREDDRDREREGDPFDLVFFDKIPRLSAFFILNQSVMRS